MLKNQGEMVWLGMAVLVALVVRLLAIRFIDANVGLDTSTYIDVASGLMSNGYISSLIL